MIRLLSLPISKDSGPSWCEKNLAGLPLWVQVFVMITLVILKITDALIRALINGFEVRGNAVVGYLFFVVSLCQYDVSAFSRTAVLSALKFYDDTLR